MSLLRAAPATASAQRASAFTRGTTQRTTIAHRTPPRVNARGRSRVAVVTHANLFSRFTRVISSYANSLITAAEDPEKILDQTVNEMQSDLIKMRQATAQVMASQKQLETKYKASQQAADDWYKRAQLAMEKGDEDLAREALTRRKSYAENAESMKANLDAQTDAVEKLIANTRLLEGKMAEAKSKKDTLKARAASAKTNKAVNDMVSGMSTSSALGAFERMEEKVLGMEAEAEAMGVFAAPDALEAQFKALESGGVDDELAALKKSLPGNQSKGALPEGRPVSEAIEAELDALRKSRDE
jgi:phage shock protein A